MRAARIHGPRDIRSETVADSSVRADEILVKVHACGICGTDVHTYRIGSPLPVIPGHEFSGEVLEVGPAVHGVHAGDRVVGTGYRNCGQCRACRSSHPERCPNPRVPGEGHDGAIAEYVIVPNPMLDSTLFRIPDGMSWEEAATIEPVAVSCFAARRARIQPEDTVVVLGAGMIGQGVAQACKAMGAYRVIVSEPSAWRRRMAGHLGADVVFDPSAVDAADAVAEATAGDMARVVFECSGSLSAFHQAPLLVRPFGTVVQVAMYEDPIELSPDQMKTMFQFRNLTLRGSGGQRWDMAVEYLKTARVRTEDLITHIFCLDDAKEAFETQLNSSEAIKVLIKPFCDA